MKALLVALIVQIATAQGVPPYMMVAIAEKESNWDVQALGHNRDGSTDIGLMQLNNSWYDKDGQDLEEHITRACALVKNMHEYYGLTWWEVLIAYNCGIARFLGDIPDVSIDYANKVFSIWQSYDRNFNKYIGR
jgi:soluble lytic murein transglycosylase-like protein